MEINFRTRGKSLIVEIEGEVDHHSSDEFRRLVERELSIEKAKNIVFDMSKVTFMDSSGIGMIIGRYKTVSALGGNICIVEPSKEANKIFTISGLYRIINVFNTMDEALKCI